MDTELATWRQVICGQSGLVHADNFYTFLDSDPATPEARRRAAGNFAMFFVIGVDTTESGPSKGWMGWKCRWGVQS